MCFKTESVVKNEEKLQIVATLFPQYDFAKQIVKDKADVKLLLNSGVETHNYEPTGKDMITILSGSDMFLYTGTNLEPWTEKIVQNLESTNSIFINEGMQQPDRLYKLNQIAISQMKILTKDSETKLLK